MCGIFGAVATAGFFDGVECERFSALTNLVRYRGPDDGDCLVLNLANPGYAEENRYDLFFGHRRLSILDLSAAGRQPMGDGCGHWIIFNGEIFNYVELRRELEAKGHKFVTGTDTEVILHVYSEYGESGFDKLNGMWAFAIADVPRKRVVLSRDRFSIKPLYLLSTDHRLYFASEIKQLLPLLPRLEPNAEVMSAFLLQGLVDHNQHTFFRGITKLPPKTNLTVCLQTGQRREQQYWDYDDSAVAPKAVGEVFRELLLDSIRIRLRSDVKVGVLLSGGLDSSTIAVACQELTNGNIETYSIISHWQQYSEEKFIDALAATGLPNVKIVFTPDDVLEDLEATIKQHDEPFGGLSVLAQNKLFRTVRQVTDATVLLSGQGGDEVLLGYLKFFFFYIRTLIKSHQYAHALSEIAQSLLRRTVVTQFSVGEAKRYIKRSDWRGRPVFIRKHVPEPIWNCAEMRSRQISDIDHYSVPALARYEDRNSMNYSLEIRLPFLDHRLVNFLVNLPAELKIRNGWTKHILRENLPELPAAIRWRREKQGFITPEESWLKREFADLIRARFQNSILSQLGYLNEMAFLAHYERFRHGSRIAASEISRALIAETWARRFFG